MPQVDTTKQDYEDNLSRWTIVEDCDSGEEQVKSKKTTYLPQPNADDTSEQNRIRYQLYLARTVFYNYINRTVTGLSGEVFAREPVIKLPSSIKPYELNIDGAGLTLEQQTKRTLKSVLKYGRAGLFVDYSKTNGEVTQEMVDEGLARPTISYYDPKSIINWRTEMVGSVSKLVLIVLQESMEVVDPDDEFVVEAKYVWRVLRLEDGIYTQVLYEKTDDQTNGDDSFVEIKDSYAIPTDAKGETFDTIPFQFVGSVNNDPQIDKTLLYDIAALNIGHYRNSADYEDNCYQNGVATVGVSIGDITPTDFQKLNGDQIRRGGTVQYGSGGDIKLVQTQANTMVHEAMGHKETQMIALGARIMQGDANNKTATATDIENRSQTSMLSTIAKNTASAYRQALYWMEVFTNRNYRTIDDIEYELSDDYSSLVFDPEKANSFASLIMSQVISIKEARDNMRNMGLKLADDEEYKDHLDNEDMGDDDNQENGE